MTRDEYTKGLAAIIVRGWRKVEDSLFIRYSIGEAERHWMKLAPADKQVDYYCYARERIRIRVGGELVSLDEYLGGF